MGKGLRILMLEDTETDAELVAYELRKAGLAFVSKRVDTREAFIHALDDFRPDIILSDYRLPDFDGMAALEIVQRGYPEVPVIIVTGVLPDIEAVELIHAGARDYVLKDRLARLAPAVQRALLAEQIIRARHAAEKALRESEEKFRSLVESTSDWIWEINEQNVYTYSSPQSYDLLGYTAEEIIGKTPFDLMPPDEAVRVKKIFGSIATERKPFQFLENANLHKDGQEVILETGGIPVFDSQGVFKGYRGIDRDITERKKVEAAIRESEFRYRMLVENSPFCIHEIDLDGRLQSMNKAGLDMLGLDDEKKICGAPYLSAVSEQDSGRINALMQDAFNGTTSHFEFAAAGKTPQYFRSSFVPIRDAGGKVIKLMGLTEDITRQKRTDEALRESESKYRSLFETAGDGIFIYGSNRFIDCNEKGANLYGLSREELIGRSAVELAPERQPDGRLSAEVAEEIIVAALDGKLQQFEWQALHADGHALDVDITLNRIELKGAACLQAVVRDISARKQAENSLREREEIFSSIVNQATDSIVLVDSETLKFIEFNQVAHESLGYTREEFAALTLADLNIQLSEKQIRKILRQSVEEKGCILFDTLHRRKNGSIRETRVSGRAITILGKAYVSAIWSDITERKRMEKQLAEREKLFHAIFSQSPNAVELIDPETLRFVEVNPAACNMLGYTHEEYLRLRLLDTQVDRDEASLRAAVRQVDASGGASFEQRHRCKNGDILDVEINARMLDLPGKRLLVGVWRDITERKRAEENLVAREREFRTLAENSPDNIARYDKQAHTLYANPELARILGVAAADLAGKTPAEISSLFVEFQKMVLHVSATGESVSFEQIGPSIEGQQPPIHFVRMVPEMGPDGTPIGVLAVGHDISKIKRAEENLRITASVFDTSQEAILITDADNAITDVNPAFTHITGYSREEVLGRNPKLLSSGRQDRAFYAAMWQSLKERGAWRGEIWNRRKSGEVYAELLSISAICDKDGKVQRHVAVFSDISHFKAHEAELSRVAHYDALTAIPNRVLLADRMKQAIAQTAREQNMMAVCYLDLDGFKAINDTMGHEAGDLVLIEVAQRILDTIRGGDTAARLGGDEFVVLLLGLEKGEECVKTLERLLKTISLPILVNNKSAALGASIGVSIYPLDDEDPDTLLRHADQAMYVAKQSGKNRFHIYDPALDQLARGHHEFLKSIRRALELNQFVLYYQPKINLSSGRLVGVEALIRWQHPEKGLLLPAEFLHAVENTELDIEIGEWVIRTALAQIRNWQIAGLDIEVSINISANHMESPFFTEKLRQQLAQYPDIPADRLQIEVLETVALQDIATVNGIIVACREFGVGFALDDFGTGYSSLSYLSRLPVDVLKIDQSFVRDMLEDKGDMAIVHGIIALAQAFEHQTVAEGIETPEHYRVLLDMGCELGQGYGIARPMTADDLIKWHLKQNL